eukprot:5581620-Ditylum_brightwellii.AAC.1
MLIKDQRKKWMMGQLKAGYKYDDLISHALKLYNNQRALDEYEEETVTKPTEKKDKSPRFIALITKLKKKIEKLRGGLQPMPMPMPTPKEKEKSKKIHSHPAWKFDRLDSKETMVRLG